MTLTYDMTFAVILLSSLYETCDGDAELHRCKVHPVKRQMMLRNEITSYAAAMNVLLAYYHMKDDWEDERKVSSSDDRGADPRERPRKSSESLSQAEPGVSGGRSGSPGRVRKGRTAQILTGPQDALEG